MLSQSISKTEQPRRVLILFNTIFLYGMERCVIETYDLLRPEIEPHLLMSYTTKRKQLPVLTEVERRNLPHSFFSDLTDWPRIGKPQSWNEVWPLFITMLRGNWDVLRVARHHDVIYVPSLQYFYFAILAALLYKLTGRKVIYSCHDLITCHSLALKLATPLLTAFRHNTKLSYDSFVRVAPTIAKKRNYIAPPCVDVRFCENELRHANRPPHDKRNILFLGQVAKHKGIGLLVEAFKQIANSYPKVMLHIVGGYEPEFKDELMRALDPAELQERVVFWGYSEDGHKLLKEAYVYAHPSLPSLFQESFGRGTVEAMAAGVPTICFRSGALEELVVHERTGIIAEVESPEALASALRKFLDDPEFTSRCGTLARERYEQHYSRFEIKPRWLEIF